MPEPQNGNHTGCGDPPLPRYPQRLLYPDHADLAQSDESVSRITTFTSSATPTLILAWYDQHAHSDGWGEHRATATEREYWYVNDTCTPAFSMTIGVTTDGIRSSVTMTRRFSGPFSGWPAD